MPSNQTKGIQLAVLTAFISGVAIFVNKFAVEAIKPPLVFTAVKNISVGLLILGIILATRKRQQIKKITQKELIYLVLIGVIGGALPFYLFFTGLYQVSAINAALIHKTLVFWVAVMAILFLKERISIIQILAVLVLFVGNLIPGGFTHFDFSRSELFILMATIFWALETILAKRVLKTVHPDIVGAARMGFGSLVLLVVAVYFYPKALANVVHLTLTQWMWLAVTALTLFAYVSSWYRALKLAPATAVAAVLVLSTLVTNILSAAFITHTWNPSLMIQALLMFIGAGLFWMLTKEVPFLSKKKDFFLHEESKV